MSRVSLIIIATFLIILPAIIAAPAETETTQEERIPARDEWWSFKDDYTDLPRIFDYDDEDNCPVGVNQFYADCNQCSCEDGMFGGCTRMACATPQIADWADGKPCPAEKKFYFKCNDCTCHQDGKSATCTDKPCPEPATA